MGEKPRKGFTLVLIGQKRNANHGMWRENGVAHLRWKKEILLVMQNDEFSSNLMDDGSRLEDEGGQI